MFLASFTFNVASEVHPCLVYVSTSFLFISCGYPTEWMYHTHYVYQLMDVCNVCNASTFLTIISNTTENISQKFLCGYA